MRIFITKVIKGRLVIAIILVADLETLNIDSQGTLNGYSLSGSPTSPEKGKAGGYVISNCLCTVFLGQHVNIIILENYMFDYFIIL